MTGSGLEPQARRDRPAGSSVSAGGHLRPSSPDASVVSGQLDLFTVDPETPSGRGAYGEPAEKARNSQMSELAGATWEDAFGNGRMSNCRSCGAAILWTRTERGKRMPLDPDPIADAIAETRGLFVLRDRGSSEGPLALAAWGLEGTEPHYRSHFSSCPNAAEHRKTAA